MLVGWRNVIRRPGRLLTTALAFALAVLVAVLIQGFAGGLYDTYAGLVRNTPVDLWVGEQGVQGVMNSFSSVPSALADELRQMPETQSVTPLYSVPVIADVGDGAKVPLVLLGYDLQSGLGGPWDLGAGRLPEGPDEVVLDKAFANNYGLAPGSTIELLGGSFRVVGLSLGTNSMMSFAAFAQREEVGRLLQAQDRTSFLLVQLTAGAGADAVRRALGASYSVLTPAEIEASSAELLDQVMGPPLDLLLGVAFLVGLAVIALTTYSGVIERRGEYGVLRALGMSGRGLAAVVATETLVSGVIGILLGSFLAAVAATMLMSLIPSYPVIVTWDGLGRTALMGLAMGLLAVLPPLHRINRLDPATVFRV